MSTSTSSTSEAPASEVSSMESACFALLHLTGARRGEEIRYETERISVGRGRNNDCSFDPEKERSVSHRHCEVRIEDNVPILYDIGSLNGTYLNGRRIRRAPMADGDEIGLGREGPRLRFLVHAGLSADPSRAADAPAPIPAEKSPAPAPAPSPPRPQQQQNRTGPTAEEVRPTGIFPAMQPHVLRRYKMGIIALGLVVICLGVTALIIISHLQGKLDGQKESSGGSPTASESFTPEGRAPVIKTPAPRSPRPKSSAHDEGARPIAPGPMRTMVLVMAQIHDTSGRVMIQRELGGGALVRSNRVATTHTVLELGRAFLQSRARGEGERSLVVARAGFHDTTIPVAGYIALSDSPPQTPAKDLALLALAETSGTPLPRALLGAPKRKPAKILSPGLPPVEVSINRFTDPEGKPVPPAQASLLRIFNLPNTPDLPLPTMSGFPIHSGDLLVGVYLGDRYPKTAVSWRLIDQLLAYGENAAPVPLK